MDGTMYISRPMGQCPASRKTISERLKVKQKFN